MPVYTLKFYVRVSRGSTVGELIRTEQFAASGMAEAQRIALRDYVAGIDFERNFIILEGDTGFVSCWLTALPDSD